jgi:hypothetical protein
MKELLVKMAELSLNKKRKTQGKIAVKPNNMKGKIVAHFQIPHGVRSLTSDVI